MVSLQCLSYQKLWMKDGKGIEEQMSHGLVAKGVALSRSDVVTYGFALLHVH